MDKTFNGLWSVLSEAAGFLWHWTIGLMIQALGNGPAHDGIVHLIMWLVVLFFLLGLALWFFFKVFELLAWLVGRGPYYQRPIVVFPILAWICAFVLIYYSAFRDIPLPR